MGIRAADIASLDPHFATTTQDRALVDMVFNGLIRYKPGDSSVFEPDLATSLPEPEMVDGKQVWTFALRQGVMCHPTADVPSYELTSEDVVYSLNKAATTDTSAYAGEYTGMSFETVDPYTVKITLEQPLSKVLFYPKVANYSGGFIVCKQAAEKLGPDGLKTHPVGTGPFMFKSYDAQEKVELVANDAYFRGKPQLDGVDFRYIADLNSVELGLRGGELDVINGAPDQIWVEKMQGVPDVKVDVFGPGEVAVLHFNTNIPPLDKLEVRQAIAYALDRDEFLALVGEAVGGSVYSPVPAQFLPGGLTQEEVAAKGVEYKTDLEKARTLLADAGFPDGFSLQMVTSEMTGYKVLYESMQAQLAKIGIKIDLQVVDHSTMHSTIRNDSNPLVIYIAWRPNADIFLTRFFHSDSIVVTGAKPDTNFSHYDKIDALIEQARAESDPEKQVALWKEAQIKILEDMVAYPIQYQSQVYARSTNVDFGHELKSVLALYPGVDETTHFLK
ncbi:MAG TPA: polyamine ABC transporter substrate-binding protein [Chloroflexi bacterium]|nr:polyamine ABC transporter substrate-binding protein [Chloroflexota bacterium]